MVDLSPQDRDMMVRTVLGEAADQPAEGQAGVASVILNRLNSGQYGDSATGVVLAPGQFEPWQTRARELLAIDPNSDSYKRVGDVVDAIASGKTKDPTGGATHFLQPETVIGRYGRLPAWTQGKTAQRIGAHVFYGGTPVDENAETARMLGVDVSPKTPTPASPVSPVSSSGPVATLSPNDITDTAKELGIDLSARPSKGTQPPQAEITPEGRLRVYVGTRAPEPSQFTEEMVRGTPIVGPAYNMAVAATRAGLEPAINPLRTLMGKPPVSAPATFGERYAANLRDLTTQQKQYENDNPVASTTAGLIGGGMALGPLAGTSIGGRLLGTVGENLAWRMMTGGAGGAGIGALDAYMRGEDPVSGAKIGAGAGVAGPLIGEGVRGGTRWLVNSTLPRTGPLSRYMPGTVSRLINGVEGETPASLSVARERMGPEGFIGDINTGLTDLTGAAADLPGPQKQIVRGAYSDRAAGQRQRISSALDKAFGTPATDVNAFNNWLTETRAKAADPLYEQWRSMQVHPTDKLKELIPRLERAGALDLGEELSGISGRPLNKKFFTTGDQKEYPTTESWDYVKRGLDRSIDRAYRAGDKTLGRELVKLKGEMIDEIGKTKAGKIWSQARSEFAERSAIIDQLAAGKDDFLGGRSGITADELREELMTLKGPELAARKVGARTAIDEAMGATLNGDGTLRAKLLAPNNQKKLRLLLGGEADSLIKTLEQEQYLMSQSSNVMGNMQTGASAPMRTARRDALVPNPMQPWDFDLTRPMSWLPPSMRDQFSIHGLVNARRGAKAERMLNELAPILTTPQKAPQFSDLLNAIHAEQARRAGSPLAGLGAAVNNRLSGLLAVPSVQRQTSPTQ